MIQSLQPVKLTVHTCWSRHFLGNMFITAAGTQFWFLYAWTCRKHQALFLARVVSLEYFSPKMISVPHQPETQKSNQGSIILLYILYIFKKKNDIYNSVISCAVLETGLNGRLDQDGASGSDFISKVYQIDSRLICNDFLQMAGGFQCITPWHRFQAYLQKISSKIDRSAFFGTLRSVIEY